MKSDHLKFQSGLMEAVEAVHDVISISKKARAIGAVKQLVSRFRNARISAKAGRKKKQSGHVTRRPYSVYPC